MLKHSTTRWLSIRRCLQRFLDQWDAFYAFFDRQVDIEPRNERVKSITKQCFESSVLTAPDFLKRAKEATSASFATSAVPAASADDEVAADDF